MEGLGIVRIVGKNFAVNIRSPIKLACLMKQECCSELWGGPW